MTPQSLRIGNYVRIKDNDTIVKVERISRRKVGFFYNGDKSRGYFRKYSEIDGVLIYDHWNKIDCPTLNWCDNTKTYYYGGFTLHKGVKYIHELQNLHYALTGEEIEIEL